MKKIFPALVLAAVSLFTFSCIADKELDGGGTPVKQGAAQVVLRLKTPDGFSPVKSRALTYAQENTIDNIFVLVFDKTGTLTAIEQGADVTSTSGHTDPRYSGEGSFSVTLEPSRTTADTYNLVVLANAQTILSNTIGFDVSQISNKSYSSVMTSLQGQLSGPMYPSGGTITMWGESGQTVIEPGTANRTLQLTRSVARIDVGVGRPTKNGSTDAWTWDGKDAASATIPFELAHVYVMKPNNRYAVAPDASKAAGDPTVPTGTSAFSLTASEANFGYAATASATGGYTSRDIYVPEADIVMGGAGTPGDENHTNRMAIVVGGYFNGSATETFYRLDFAVNKALVNVLRNHLYQFNISKVIGPGFKDPETAYNSLAMNMAVDIYEWNETDMGEIVFDGQNYLSITPKSEFQFSRIADMQTVNIKTDVPAGWKITKITESDGTTLINQTTGWLRTDKSVGTPYGTGEANVQVNLTVTENTTGVERTGYVYIQAGRLEARLTVTQDMTNPVTLNITSEGYPVSELVFTTTDMGPKTLDVSWFPQDADLQITNSNIAGYPVFAATSGIPLTETVAAGNGGTGRKSFTITAPAFTTAELNSNPFMEKVSKVSFLVTNGFEDAYKSILVRHANFALTHDLKSQYLLDNSLTHTITIKSNTQWQVVSVTGATEILDTPIADILAQFGGNNTTTGDPLTFKLITDTDLIHSGKTITITLTDPTGKFTANTVLVINSVSCGRNGTATYMTIGNNSYLTHAYGGKCWMVQNLKEGTSIGTGAGNDHAAKTYNNFSAESGYANGYYYTRAQAELICPAGWHIPTDAERANLFAAVSGANLNTPAAKWWCGSQGAPNGAYAGVRTSLFENWGAVGCWWYGTAGQYIQGQGSNIMTGTWPETYWLSVRCVKD